MWPFLFSDEFKLPGSTDGSVAPWRIVERTPAGKLDLKFPKSITKFSGRDLCVVFIARTTRTMARTTTLPSLCRYSNS